MLPQAARNFGGRAASRLSSVRVPYAGVYAAQAPRRAARLLHLPGRAIGGSLGAPCPVLRREWPCLFCPAMARRAQAASGHDMLARSLSSDEGSSAQGTAAREKADVTCEACTGTVELYHQHIFIFTGDQAWPPKVEDAQKGIPIVRYADSHYLYNILVVLMRRGGGGGGRGTHRGGGILHVHPVALLPGASVLISCAR